MRYFCTIIFFIVLVSACNKAKEHDVSFYYWKSKLSLSEKETEVLQKLKSRKLYIKFFDLKLNSVSGKIFPVSNLRIDTGFRLKNISIIPCVYIENQVLMTLDSSKIDSLANLVLSKINNLYLQFPSQQLSEIHIDCDWTKRTKRLYFDFLVALQKNVKAKVSCTIRLHQIKYAEKTGIPPVKNAVLMCYNMGKIQDENETNSIFRIDIMKNYTRNLSAYPLHLDIAFPIYEWTVVFRNHRFMSISTNNSVYEKVNKLEQIGANRYLCTSSTRMAENAILKGDILRREFVSTEEIKEATHWFEKQLKDFTILYYHLDEQNIKKHEKLF